MGTAFAINSAGISCGFIVGPLLGGAIQELFQSAGYGGKWVYKCVCIYVYVDVYVCIYV